MRAHLALLVIVALAAFAPAAFAQDPVPTDPVITEPAPAQPAPDPSPAPAPSSPPKKATPKPRPTARPVQRQPAPRVSAPSRPRTSVVTRTPAPTVRQQSRQPERQRPVRRQAVRKPAKKQPAQTAKKKETTKAIRPTRELPAAGGVAGTVASAAPASPEAASLPSELVSSTPEDDGGIAVTSIVFSTAILLGLCLLALAAVPNRQLAILPASRWIAMRRLDLVIGGAAALIGVLAALVISEVMGP